MQFSFVFIMKSIVVPTFAILIPFLILAYRKLMSDFTILLSKRQIVLLFTRWFGLSFLIFVLLSYLTGDLAYFFLLESGSGTIAGGFYFTIGEHWFYTFRLNPGMSLLSISFLSGLLYASIWTLPPICTNVGAKQNEEEGGNVDKKSTISSGLSASISAIASTTVCCSTSVAAIIAPAITSILGPFVPFLLYLSMIILIYSIYKIVLPRFPTSDI